MKKLAIILITLIVGVMGNNAIANNKKNEKTVVFHVKMHCHKCVNKIEGNIAYEKGVKDLKVSLGKNECTVTFRKDKTSVDNIIEAFEKIGYKAILKEKYKDTDCKNEAASNKDCKLPKECK